MSKEAKIKSWQTGDDPVVGYLWLSDFVTELGFNPHGARLFPTLADCEASRKSENDDGIVKVEVKLTQLVKEPKNLAGLISDLRQYRRSWTAIEIPTSHSEEPIECD